MIYEYKSNKNLNSILMYWLHFKALWSQTDLTEISQIFFLSRF